MSAFLWVEKENLLINLFPGKIIIPKPVYDELSYPTVRHLKLRADALLSDGSAKIETIQIGTEVFNLYYQLTVLPKSGQMVIGKGEAASIALAKFNNGIVASNNLKDILSYIREFHLKQITTGDILMDAMKKAIYWTGGPSTPQIVNISLVDVTQWVVVSVVVNHYQNTNPIGLYQWTIPQNLTINHSHKYQFYIEDAQLSTWIYGPEFNIT